MQHALSGGPYPRPPSLYVPNIPKRAASSVARRTARTTPLQNATIIHSVSSVSSPILPYVLIGRHFTCSLYRRSLSASPFNAAAPRMAAAFPHFLACGFRTITSMRKYRGWRQRQPGERKDKGRHVRHQPQSAVFQAPLSMFFWEHCSIAVLPVQNCTVEGESGEEGRTGNGERMRGGREEKGRGGRGREQPVHDKHGRSASITAAPNRILVAISYWYLFRPSDHIVGTAARSFPAESRNRRCCNCAS